MFLHTFVKAKLLTFDLLFEDLLIEAGHKLILVKSIEFDALVGVCSFSYE